ncbi:MAG: alcohol dehydrogenase catalytic domain-containing protein [Planctomycetes bacterium]|nr:alcohol dehydrogenase catalytic domain-containing protein [Planctomycetota bacterium]
MIDAYGIIADGKGGFSKETFQVAAPGPGEVLVQIKASGVCHTDYDSLKWGSQMVMGHEGAGIVLECGAGIKDITAGDAVVLNWAQPCGGCFQCQRGNQVHCEDKPVINGQHLLYNNAPLDRSFFLGTMASHAVVVREAVTKITCDIPFTSACIMGCGVMTGLGSVLNAAHVEPEASVAVLGTGGVGLNVIQGARIAAASKIIAVDISQSRLDMAKDFGATHCVLADTQDTGLLKAAQLVKELCDGRGADYSFECTAIPSLGAAPLAMIRHAGTAVQVSGIEEEITIDMNLFEWDKIYINPLYGKCRPEIDFPRMFDFYESGQLKLDELVTQTYDLDDLKTAFADMHAGKNAKGVLVLDN